MTDAHIRANDALAAAGFRRVDDWLIRGEHTDEEEAIHIDTVGIICAAAVGQKTPRWFALYED